MRPPATSNATVEVWRVPLAHFASAEPAAFDLLPPAEQERARQFRAGEARLRFVAGRAALRKLLGTRLDLLPAAVPLVVDERGKPQLATPPPSTWHFNLSHSGQLVLIALAWNAPVGVDVETERPLENWRSLAVRSFSPAEVRELASLPEAERTTAFFQTWTRREAFLKATGQGLAGALGRELTSGPDWTVIQFLAAPTHPAAVAVRHPAATLTVQDVSP